MAFSSDLTHGLLYQVAPTLNPEAPTEYANLYGQDTANPLVVSPLVGSEPPNRSTEAFTLTYAGASADFSRIFFEANDALTEETPFAPQAADGGAEKHNLYEWSEGRLALVNVLPGNTETLPGAAFGAREGQYVKATLFHAISADGSRVFWSDESGQLYVRVNGETTMALPEPGKFLAASADGSKVLLDNGHLHALGDEEPTVDLTQGKGGFEGILGQSEDLSHIYFVDTAVLDETPSGQGAAAQAGKDNLYSWSEGVTAFVATLLPEDNAAGGGVGDWVPPAVSRTAEASPNGRWVAFLSRAQLTGYDNSGPSTGACRINPLTPPIGPCVEAFLYDSRSGKLICAACNPSEVRPFGPSALALIHDAEGSMPQPRYLSDSGRLFFDSQDSLSPSDTNNGVEDVYEYEPEGVGTCGRQGGCVSLISAGHEPVDSNFLAADPSGKNVFFTTRDQLTLRDHDELVDVYDAREGGGIPSETEASRGECQGEACQAQVSAPNDPTPGSSTFEGAGNVDEKKPAKKKAHKKKHAKKHKAKKKSAHKRAANNNRRGAK